MDLSLPAALQCLPFQWRDIAADFLRHIYGRRLSLASLRSYRMVLVQFFSSIGKHPERVTRADIEAFLWQACARTGKTPTPGTRNVRLTRLRSFYTFAASYLPVINPTTGVARASSSRNYRALSVEEVERFFAVIPTDTPIGIRDRAIFALYFWTGRRREEIARLRYGDIEPAPYLASGWRFRYIGKGKAGRPSYAELPRQAKAALDRYLEQSGRKKTIKAEDPLFVPIGPKNGGGRRRGPGQPLDSDSIHLALKQYAKAANLKSMSIHSWRHTAARQRLEAGLDVVSLKEFLGHESLDYTFIYARSMLGMADKGAQLIESRFTFL